MLLAGVDGLALLLAWNLPVKLKGVLDMGFDEPFSIATALQRICFGTDQEFPLEETIDRYFSAGFVEVVDGQALDRQQFVQTLRQLRTMVTGGRVEVLADLREGDEFAHRHLLHLEGADGSVMRREVYMFGVFGADGRLLRIDEVSRQDTGSPSAPPSAGQLERETR